MNTELLPCPFCGTKNVILEDNRNGAYWVECKDCGCSMYCDQNKEDAVEDWNHRTPII